MFDFLKKETSKVIHVNDIDNLIGKVELIDIREPYEYQSGSIKTAKNIPMGTLLGNPEKYLIQGKTYYVSIGRKKFKGLQYAYQAGI